MDEQSLSSFTPIEWESTEFVPYKKDWRWYVIAIVLAVFILAYAIYAKQWLFGVTIIILLVAIFVVDRAKPKLLKCRVDATGLTINESKFTYDQLKLFWFHQAEGKLYVNLLSTSRMLPPISLTIPADYQDRLRTALSKTLPESDANKDNFVDKLGRILKI